MNLVTSAAMQETQFQSLGQEDPLAKEMAIYFSILTWKTIDSGLVVYKPQGHEESDMT